MNFIMGAKNGSTDRGQGNYQGVTVTLQLLKDLAFQKGQCPFAMGLSNLPSRKDFPEPGLPAWFTDQSSSTERLSCPSGRLQWAIIKQSEYQATEYTPSSSCTF